jgi:hypothetical protein
MPLAKINQKSLYRNAVISYVKKKTQPQSHISRQTEKEREREREL